MTINFSNLNELKSRYEDIKKRNYILDLTRGKPHKDQLDLSNQMLAFSHDELLNDHLDLRNYGDLTGLLECRVLGSRLLGCSEAQVIAGGNSSLTLMYQYLSSRFFGGLSTMPWSHLETVSLICPVPGYDRHFRLSETFGINMINVPLTGEGPDMDQVEALVKKDSSVKGIWCVPKHSNPTGDIYSSDCVERLASISLDNDFTVLWDNAYSVHDFDESFPLKNIFTVADEIGTTNSIVAFASTSKITFAGGGIGFIGMSENKLEEFLTHYASMVIGPDKINQTRHTKFFSEITSIEEHMGKHALLVKPKFDLVQDWLSKLNYGDWTKPTGGYFVSFNSQPGLAREIISLADKAGLKLTKAGSAFPYGVDPEDKNIRIAPTACSIEEVNIAMELFVICTALATLNSSSS